MLVLVRFSLSELSLFPFKLLLIKKSLNDITIYYFFNIFANFFYSFHIMHQTWFFYFNSRVNCLFETTRLNFFKGYFLQTYITSLLKSFFYLSAGFLVPFKRRFFLSGRINRILRLKKRYLWIKLGYVSDVILHSDIYSYFKPFKLKHSFYLISSNLFFFSNFTFLIRHLRYRGVYTGRGVRIYKEPFQIKKRPDFGKFGIKMSFY